MIFEFYIENTLVDVKDPQSAAFVYQINDMQNPDSRQTDFSYSMTLPGTSVNDQLLGSIFEINGYISNGTDTNFNPDFNPNLKAKAKVFIDSVINFDGIVQLTKINVTNTYQVEYEVQLFGKLANPFKNMGDKYLSDLDLSRFDHPYDFDTINKSLGFTYIKINGVDTAFVNGTGYQYSLIDWGYSSDLVNFPIESFKPLLFIKTVWDQIFEDAEFTITSNWITSGGVFDKLLMTPAITSIKIDNADVPDYVFVAVNDNDHDFGSNTTTSLQYEDIKLDDDSTPPAFDTLNQYDTATGYFTVGTGLAATRTFVAKLYFQAYLDITDGGYAGSSVSADGYTNLTVYVNKYTASTGLWSTVYVNSGQIRYDINTFTNNYTSDNPGALYADGGEYQGSMWNSENANMCTVVVPNLLLLEGDKIRIRVGHSIAGAATFGGFTGTTTIRVLGGSTEYCVLSDAVIVEGGTMTVNSLLSDKIKQKDFIMSVIKAFNLYVDYDNDTTNNLLIEPRDTYYTSTVVNWERKLDYSKPIEQRPMGALEVKTYKIRYKSDNDYYNKLYQDEFKEPYGSRQQDVSNDFLKDEKLTEIIFSPTPLIGNDFIDRPIPRIIQWDGTIVKTFDANIRLLYNAGAKACAPWNIIYDHGASVQSYTTYPLTAHLDDAYNPTIDLSFGMPRRIYWDNRFNTINYTDNNLFNAYFFKWFSEISDRNSKVVTAYFFLGPNDISELDFRKLYFFNNAYFRLNKIDGYNPLASDVVKCEFLKIQYADPYTTTTYELSDAVIGSDFENAPVFSNESFSGKPVANLSGQTRNVIGTGNQVFSNDNILVVGDNNVIAPDTKNVQVFSDGVVVHAGLSDVQIYNSPGIEVTESGKSYINGVDLDSNSGTYTPTLTSVSNVSSSTASECQYMRVGNTVTVSGKLAVTPTAGTTTTQLGISIPIASNFGANEDCAGTANVPAATPVVGSVKADATNNRAELGFVSTGNTSVTFYFIFTYQVI